MDCLGSLLAPPKCPQILVIHIIPMVGSSLRYLFQQLVGWFGCDRWLNPEKGLYCFIHQKVRGKSINLKMLLAPPKRPRILVNHTIPMVGSSLKYLSQPLDRVLVEGFGRDPY